MASTSVRVAQNDPTTSADPSVRSRSEKLTPPPPTTAKHGVFGFGGGWAGQTGLFLTTQHHLGGGGGSRTAHPSFPPPPPALRDWAKFLSGRSANQNFYLAPSAPVSFGHNVSSALLTPPKSPHRRGAGGLRTHPPHPPLSCLYGLTPCTTVRLCPGTRCP